MNSDYQVDYLKARSIEEFANALGKAIKSDIEHSIKVEQEEKLEKEFNKPFKNLKAMLGEKRKDQS